MHVVCVGLATVDLVHRVQWIPGVDEKAEASSVETAAGGPATNAAVAAAALGATVTLVTAVGRHPLGQLIREDLDAHGVTLLDTMPHAIEPPPVSAITVLAATGQRTIVSRNAADVQAPVPPGLDRVIEAADVVLVDGHHPAPAVTAAAAGRRAGRLVMIDAGSWRPVMGQLLPRVDVAACSAAFRHPDAVAGGDTATAAALRARGVRHIAVTHGPNPVHWFSDDHTGTVAVPPVDAVDTSGAGDVFHGALAVALAYEVGIVDLAAAIRSAVTVAGIRVTHPGPRAWLADPALRSVRR